MNWRRSASKLQEGPRTNVRIDFSASHFFYENVRIAIFRNAFFRIALLHIRIFSHWISSYASRRTHEKFRVGTK